MTHPTITRTELQALIDAGDVTVVEALPAEHYAQGHLPGAINVPHTEVRDLAPTRLPDKHAQIVVYCANEPCANSGIATHVLRKLGYTNVREYAEGKDDWAGAGLPLEQAAAVTG